MNAHTTSITCLCRLCGGDAVYRFQLQVLRQHDVSYFECLACGSLQTEEPHWLDQAYGKGNLSSLDTGAAQRNIENVVASWAVARIFGLRHVLDVGGGDGLLCRLLRDFSLNAFVQDRYAVSTYAQGFEQPDFETPDLLVAFEVLEHFARPREEVARLFAAKPRVMLLSTSRYRQQATDWWYLVPDSGQHVFFYSQKALAMVADLYGYSLTIREDYLLFVRKGCPRWRRGLASLALHTSLRRWLKCWIFALQPTGVMADFRILSERRSPPHR